MRQIGMRADHQTRAPWTGKHANDQFHENGKKFIKTRLIIKQCQLLLRSVRNL